MSDVEVLRKYIEDLVVTLDAVIAETDHDHKVAMFTRGCARRLISMWVSKDPRIVETLSYYTVESLDRMLEDDLAHDAELKYFEEERLYLDWQKLMNFVHFLTLQGEISSELYENISDSLMSFKPGSYRKEYSAMAPSHTSIGESGEESLEGDDQEEEGEM